MVLPAASPATSVTVSRWARDCGRTRRHDQNQLRLSTPHPLPRGELIGLYWPAPEIPLWSDLYWEPVRSNCNRIPKQEQESSEMETTRQNRRTAHRVAVARIAVATLGLGSLSASAIAAGTAGAA